MYIDMEEKKRFEDDEERVIADMSGIERQPVLFPSADSIRRVKENRADFSEPPEKNYSHGPDILR